MAEGHADADQYPLWRVKHEAELVRYRMNTLLKGNMVLIAAAVASHKSKKANAAFMSALEKIDG